MYCLAFDVKTLHDNTIYAIYGWKRLFSDMDYNIYHRVCIYLLASPNVKIVLVMQDMYHCSSEGSLKAFMA